MSTESIPSYYEDPHFLHAQYLQDVTAFVSLLPNHQKRVPFAVSITLKAQFPLSDAA